jgi:DNA-directed RNA polymerase subunit RPC12/RpoP
MIKLINILKEMKCWDGYKPGTPKTKISYKTGKRVNNCVPIKELVTDTEVICDDCGWKWDIAKGGNDLYVCHECGHDNTPKL